jgi:hypothetical protein
MSKSPRDRDKARQAERQRIADSINAAARLPCLLCGRARVYVVGLFVAHNQSKVNAPAKKTRAIAYALCRRCVRTPGHQARCETKIFEQAKAMARAAAAANN